MIHQVRRSITKSEEIAYFSNKSDAEYFANSIGGYITKIEVDKYKQVVKKDKLGLKFFQVQVDVETKSVIHVTELTPSGFVNRDIPPGIIDKGNVVIYSLWEYNKERAVNKAIDTFWEFYERI